MSERRHFICINYYHNRLAVGSVLITICCSYIHTNITMRFLTCEPNLADTEGFQTEATQFYTNPIKWLKTEVVKGPNKHVFSHVVMFDSLPAKIGKFLEKGSYKLCAKYFYSHFPEESEKSRHIDVYCR